MLAVRVASLVSLAALAACGGHSATLPTGPADAGHHEDAPPTTLDAGSDVVADAGTEITQTLITEPTDGMMPVYAFIASAKESLDMTMYELEDTTVTTSLTNLVKSGVKVRVILDQNLEMQSNTTAYNALAAGGVEVHWADPTYAATHQKTITVDAKTSAIMTLNFSPEYYPTSREFAILTNDPADVAAIESTFAADFASTPITPANGTDLVWSPTNSESVMLGLINGAQKTLMIENEEMSDGDVVGALNAAAKRGVDVEVIMTNSRSWSAEFSSLSMSGVHVVTYARNASLYIHAKVILADYGESGASVLVGSENFSNASLTENRELGIVTTNAAILSSIHTTLASDFSGGTPTSS
jgi:phosphatidylserine/phosphatidylglycerophosphate/cardiolipin synthase-like enzyme